jgi:hypothetical protein
MEHLSSAMEQQNQHQEHPLQVERRRDKVQELSIPKKNMKRLLVNVYVGRRIFLSRINMQRMFKFMYRTKK